MHWIKYLSCIFLNSSNKFRDNITPIVNSLHLMNIYYLLYNYITIYYIYYLLYILYNYFLTCRIDSLVRRYLYFAAIPPSTTAHPPQNDRARNTTITMTNLLFNRCFERERNFIKVTNYSIYYELKILQFGCEPLTKRSNQSLRIFYLFITTEKLVKKEKQRKFVNRSSNFFQETWRWSRIAWPCAGTQWRARACDPSVNIITYRSRCRRRPWWRSRRLRRPSYSFSFSGCVHHDEENRTTGRQMMMDAERRFWQGSKETRKENE